MQPLCHYVYQELAIDQLRGALSQHPRALLVMPTGSGKTVVFLKSAASQTQKAVTSSSLFTAELVKQASDKLTKAGVTWHYRCRLQASAHPVQVASVQTLARRLLTVPAEPDLLVIDEAHHAVAGSWDKILLHFKNAKVIGVTATPSRLDGRGLGSHFSTLVSGPSVEQLTKLGFLSPHRVFAPPVIADLRNVKTRAGDYANDQLSQAMDRPTITGDAVSTYSFALTVYLLLLLLLNSSRNIRLSGL